MIVGVLRSSEEGEETGLMDVRPIGNICNIRGNENDMQVMHVIVSGHCCCLKANARSGAIGVLGDLPFSIRVERSSDLCAGM